MNIQLCANMQPHCYCQLGRCCRCGLAQAAPPAALVERATPTQTLRGSLPAEESQAEFDEAVAGMRESVSDEPPTAVVERAALEQLIVTWLKREQEHMNELGKGTTNIPLWHQGIWSTYSIVSDELEALLRAVPSERENGKP